MISVKKSEGFNYLDNSFFWKVCRFLNCDCSVCLAEVSAECGDFEETEEQDEEENEDDNEEEGPPDRGDTNRPSSRNMGGRSVAKRCAVGLLARVCSHPTYIDAQQP